MFLRALVLAVAIALASAAAVRAGRADAPALGQLAFLPDAAPLHREVLLGDLDRLRAAYPNAQAFAAALAGVWLPDALAGAQTSLWRRTYGFDLRNVERFAAAGFHPAELLVASGRFDSAFIRSTLLAHGYRARGALLARGADGSIDPATPAGRLSLSALDRVVSEAARLKAASTTALVRPAPRSLAADADLAAVARALGTTTSGQSSRQRR